MNLPKWEGKSDPSEAWPCPAAWDDICEESSVTRAVLGIDAAWTPHNPSGVALAVETGGLWRLAAVEASYGHFLALAEEGARIEGRPAGDRPDPARLLAAARKIAGRPVDLVAVDMPLAHSEIKCRRASDLAVTKLYASRAAATHSPSAIRPGKISDDLRAGFAAQGYRLLTGGLPEKGLIEVYPHPALIEFLRAPRRLQYKAAKSAKYWPEASPAERRKKLLAVWRQILGDLEARIGGVTEALLLPADSLPTARLKAFEDKLDAVVCAAVGIVALRGEATTYGDEDSAIWVPTPPPAPRTPA